MPSEVYKRSERIEHSRCDWDTSFNAFAGKLSFVDLKRKKLPLRFYEFLKWKYVNDVNSKLGKAQLMHDNIHDDDKRLFVIFKCDSFCLLCCASL
jgi:hypothetical protein